MPAEMGGCPADPFEASVARCHRADHCGGSEYDGDRAPHPINEPACGLLFHWTIVGNILVKGNLNVWSRTSVVIVVN